MNRLALKDIEKRVNDEGVTTLGGLEGKVLEYGLSYQIIFAVKAKLTQVLKDAGYDYPDVYLSNFGQNVYLKVAEDHTFGRTRGIKIRIKKKIAKKEIYDTYYSFDKIEIESPEIYDPIEGKTITVRTIEDYFNVIRNINKTNAVKESIVMNNFVKGVKNSGITLDKFFELKVLYEKLSYHQKKEIGKELFGDEYYKYI